MATCKKHPRYRAKRQPMTPCRVCWELILRAEQAEREVARLKR